MLSKARIVCIEIRDAKLSCCYAATLNAINRHTFIARSCGDVTAALSLTGALVLLRNLEITFRGLKGMPANLMGALCQLPHQNC